MKTHHWQARTRDELIIEVWEALDCESVGARELLAIQDALRETLGVGAVVSPASIARVVVDEGAVLRHPEVLNCDIKWRARSLAASRPLEELDFSTLEAAATSIKQIDELRMEAETEPNNHSVKQLRDLVIQAGKEARLIARSTIVPERERAAAKEICEWVRIWLQQPALFDDWLSLRQRSPEYQRKFAEQLFEHSSE